MINLKGFSVTYPGADKPALQDISLQISAGECLMLVGRTGCGKTTLLRAMAGLLREENGFSFQGEASVKDTALSRINLSEWAPRVGILFQNPNDQVTSLTPREEISFGLENLGYDLQTTEEKTVAASIENDVEAKLDSDITTLSGGQLQRVVFASIFAMTPEVLLLDEPLSNLDWSGRKKLVHVIAKAKAQGKTIILCSHELEEMLPVCDRVVHLDEGKIASQLTPEELISNDQLSLLFGLKAEEKDKGRGYSTNPDAFTNMELSEVKINLGKGEFICGPIGLSFKAGERVALAGLNGSGKTTLMKAMAGMIKPDSGEIKYLGRDGIPLKRKKVPEFIAYVSQNSDLMLHCDSVEKELLSRINYLKPRGYDREKALSEGLEQFNLEHLRARHPFSLSQGQRQRTALAAAVMGGAGVLLIDEPTTGQDWHQTRDLLTRLEKLSGEGMSVIFSTHNIPAARLMAERLIVLSQGHIVFDGPMGDVDNQKLMEIAMREK